MFMQIIPEGGYVWEDGSKIEIERIIDTNYELHLRYNWKSRYCKAYQIPCNTAVRTFDAFMERTEMQLDHAKSTGDKVAADQIRKEMDKLIEDFKENCEKNRLFY